MAIFVGLLGLLFLEMAAGQFDYDNIIFPLDDGSFTWPSRPATPESLTTTTPSPEYSRCTQGCLVTSQYSPVCGTNKQTYPNVNTLKCAQICGLDVEVLHIGRCSDLREIDKEALYNIWSGFIRKKQEV